MQNIVVLGLGDSFWCDCGFGMRAVEALHARYSFPPNVTLVDGAADGEALLPLVEEADVLVIADAVDSALPPGTVKTFEGAGAARRLRKCEIALHQVWMADALEAARRNGRLPSCIRLVGAQPLDEENYGASLSAMAKAQVNEAVREIVAFLDSIGVAATPRPAGAQAEPLHPAVMDLSVFESGSFA